VMIDSLELLDNSRSEPRRLAISRNCSSDDRRISDFNSSSGVRAGATAAAACSGVALSGKFDSAARTSVGMFCNWPSIFLTDGSVRGELVARLGIFVQEVDKAADVLRQEGFRFAHVGVHQGGDMLAGEFFQAQMFLIGTGKTEIVETVDDGDVAVAVLNRRVNCSAVERALRNETALIEGLADDCVLLAAIFLDVGFFQVEFIERIIEFVVRLKVVVFPFLCHRLLINSRLRCRQCGRRNDARLDRQCRGRPILNFVRIENIVAIPLLREKHLAMRGVILVDGVVADERVKVREQPAFLGAQDAAQALRFFLPRAECAGDLDRDVRIGQID
jgi:hypothetical protein